MAWQPLHVRLAGGDEGLYDGVPEHLRAQIWDWAEEAFIGETRNFDRGRMLSVCNMARLPLTPGISNGNLLVEIKKYCCLVDPHSLLSVVDALLNKFGSLDPSWVKELDECLRVGNSMWTVAPDGMSITSRVDPTAAEAVAQAIAPHDAASEELAEAWRKAYGREPNPSDAWDHSIKAVEHLLKPVVCPNNAVATLGKIVGDLRSQPQLWKLVLPGTNGDFSVNRLVAMLELIWPNPDRHGGSTATVVTIEQAHAVVHLAVTIVLWGRAGVL